MSTASGHPAQHSDSISARRPVIRLCMKRKTWRIAGINFDHFHMGDLLRMAAEHPHGEVVGISDEKPARMEERSGRSGLPA